MAKYKVTQDFKNDAIEVKQGDIIDAELYKGNNKFLNASIGTQKYLLPKNILQEHIAPQEAISKPMSLGMKALPFAGIAAGIGVGLWRKMSPVGIIGAAIFGGIVFSIPIFVWRKKDMADAMVGKPLDKDSAVHKLYLLLSNMFKQKNEKEKTNVSFVNESKFTDEVNAQKMTDSELMFLYDFNKGMFELLGLPSEEFSAKYNILSSRLSSIYDASIINEAQKKFNQMNILPKGTI